MKILHYFMNRFNKKNLKKTVPIYAFALIILMFYGVKGLMTTFFVALLFIMGWLSHSAYIAIKDYRLTLALNRVHYSQADYQTLKRENMALMDAVQALMNKGGSGGGSKGPLRPVAPPTQPPNRQMYSMEDIEEMRMRYEAEDIER